MTEPIINMARELSKNRQTLAKLHLFRTTASYKMLYGTKKTFNDKLAKTLQTAPFALNMDEATAWNNSRLCTVLVTYSKGNNIITEHLNSFATPVVSGEILFEGMKSLFERRKLSWINLLAILMDTCSVLRGSKSGLEKRLRDSVVTHLLDIDGDICHHIHNIVKKFMTTLDNLLEKLFQDIFGDFHLSSDLLQELKEICYYLGLTVRVPSNYIRVFAGCRCMMSAWSSLI